MSLQVVRPVDVCHGEVRGHILDTDELHSSIPFASPSDALFTSLFLKHKRSVLSTVLALSTIFDDVLALFRHPEFCSGKVTVQGTDDIYIHIANQRQIIAQNRNRKRASGQTSTKLHSTPHAQVPRLVVELVAEYLDSHRDPFHRTFHIPEGPITRKVGCDVSHMFAKMSLVHRSWADVAQPFLRRRIHLLVNERDALQPMLLLPQFGPWVRELCLVSCNALAESDETPRSLYRVLQRCPNITHLHLDGLLLGGPDDETSYDVLGQIANLTCLEHLWLQRAPKATQYNGFLKKLCAILPGLRYLKSLLLEFKDEWRFYPEGMEPAAASLTDALSPPATLAALSLIKFNIFNSGIWRWFLNPDGDNRIRSLELSCDDISRSDRQTGVPMDITPLLKNAMTVHVTTLQLLCCYGDSDLRFIKDSFPSLQSLSLCFNPDWAGTHCIPRAEVVTLPNSVQNLYIYFGSPPLKDQDSIVLGMLRAHPHVRRMIFTYFQPRSTPSYLIYFPQLLFNETRKYAIMNDVELQVSALEAPPHFFDL